MIDILVGFFIIVAVYALGLFSGLFASAMIIAKKDRDQFEKNLDKK